MNYYLMSSISTHGDGEPHKAFYARSVRAVRNSTLDESMPVSKVTLHYLKRIMKDYPAISIQTIV